MKKTLGEFEQYLREIYDKDSIGTDWKKEDDMPYSFNDWISELDAEEMREYAEKWGEEAEAAQTIQDILQIPGIEEIIDNK